MAETANNNGEHVDLLILDDDIAVDAGGCAQYIDGRSSIAQDIVHQIRESGLLKSLIGERDQETRASYLIELIEIIEDDERLIPGTTKITESDVEQYWIQSQTVDYNELGFWL